MMDTAVTIVTCIAAGIFGAIMGHLTTKWAGRRWGIDGQLIVIALWCVVAIVGLNILN